VADEENQGFLDSLVHAAARLLNAVGLNGNRLLWRWRQRRQNAAEAGYRRSILWRGAKAKHKMCNSCRALVPRDERLCPECGASLQSVSTPGVGRAVGNLFPGASSVTSLLLLVNGFWFVIMLLAQIKSGASGGGGLFGGFSSELLVRFGSGLSDPVRLSSGEIVGGEWWRLITPIFLHGGLLHFFFNSFILLQLGPVVQETYGAERFWVIYLLCGIVGAMTTFALTPWITGRPFVNTVGASGAILGLIGLLLVFGLRHGSVLGQVMKRFIGRMVIYMIVLSLFVNIDHLNHIGGFLCGGALGFLVPARPPSHPAANAAWGLASLAGVLLVLFAFYKVALQGSLSAV